MSSDEASSSDPAIPEPSPRISSPHGKMSDIDTRNQLIVNGARELNGNHTTQVHEGQADAGEDEGDLFGDEGSEALKYIPLRFCN